MPFLDFQLSFPLYNARDKSPSVFLLAKLLRFCADQLWLTMTSSELSIGPRSELKDAWSQTVADVFGKLSRLEQELQVCSSMRQL